MKQTSLLSISVLFIISSLLFSAFVLAAPEVIEKNSGITRGSIEYLFTYDPADLEPVVITGVLQSDLTTVLYKQAKIELYWKSRIGDAWSYEILHGERGLSIKLGEQKEFDIDGDGIMDVSMEFTRWEDRKGTLTFYNAQAAEEVISNESVPPSPPDVPAFPEKNDEQDDLGLVEEEVEIVIPNVTEESDATKEEIASSAEEERILFGFGIALFIMIIALVCAFVIWQVVSSPKEEEKEQENVVVNSDWELKKDEPEKKKPKKHLLTGIRRKTRK